jgi:formamidopyrimidine-DNA glycosylase
MPELPEVETIVRDLAPRLTGRMIVGVQVWDPLLVRFPQGEDFNRRLTGRIIRSVTRRGKYILATLSGGLTLLVHLRMTGRLLTKLPQGERRQRAAFDLDDGSRLWYCDLRRFGDMWAFWPGEEDQLGGFVDLGPEPLAADFNADWLRDRFTKRKAPVKSLLLDQSLVAGLGNIYVDESLFEAGIHPGRTGASLSSKECRALAAAVKDVIARAIQGRGTTFRDYRSGLGTAGEYQHQLQVYGRAGQPCPGCGELLLKRRIGGRTTVFCPHCQC